MAPTPCVVAVWMKGTCCVASAALGPTCVTVPPRSVAAFLAPLKAASKYGLLICLGMTTTLRAAADAGAEAAADGDAAAGEADAAADGATDGGAGRRGRAAGRRYERERGNARTKALDTMHHVTVSSVNCYARTSPGATELAGGCRPRRARSPSDLV